MRAGVLAWRRIATADVTAASTAAQVEPPAAAGEAFDATIAGARVNEPHARTHRRETMMSMDDVDSLTDERG